MPSLLKVRLDESDNLDAGTAIVVEKRNHDPSELVSITISNDETHASVKLSGEQARQIAMALISAFGGGGDAG